MSTKNRTRSGTLAASALMALSLTACAPGGSAPAESSSAPASDDISGAGEVTLSVWDQNTDEGINEAQEALNDAFTKKYPNVTIEREVPTPARMSRNTSPTDPGAKSPSCVEERVMTVTLTARLERSCSKAKKLQAGIKR